METNYLSNKKIFDVVIFKGDFDMLKHRFENFYNVISRFYLLIEQNRCENCTHSLVKHFGKWIDKITIIECDEIIEDFYSQSSSDYTKFLSELHKENLSFDDIICFSDESEFPEFDLFDSIFEKIDFEPIVLRQKDLVYNTKYICLKKHIGTLCLNYSQLLNTSKFLFNFNSQKSFYQNSIGCLVDNGFNHSFAPNPKIEKKIVNFEDIYPFNKIYLKEPSIIPSTQDEILVILNFYQNKLNLDESEKIIMNINFTYDYSLMEKTTSENLHNINIFLPPVQYYNFDFPTDYETTFLLNEVKKELKKMQFLNEQKLKIVGFFDFLDLQNCLEITWGEIKKLRFDTYLLQILKKPSEEGLVS